MLKELTTPAHTSDGKLVLAILTLAFGGLIALVFFIASYFLPAPTASPEAPTRGISLQQGGLTTP